MPYIFRKLLLNVLAVLCLFGCATAQPLIKEHFGVTSVMTITLDKMDDIKLVRTYTSAGTFCRYQEDYMFEPTWQNFHYDRTLDDAKARGMKFVMCITNNMPYYTTSGTTENEDHPVPPGANKEDPASYVMYGKLFFQLAARYGSKVVADSLLKVKDFPATDYRHQTKRSGTNLLYGIELWNEANKWGGNFTPREYYAMLSACYDGHKGTLGIDVGVMQADPDFNLLFTGTSDHTPTYHTAVRDIWVQERGEPFPENIIYNFHGYFHNKAINNNNRTTGIAPELGGALSIYRTWQQFAGNNRVAKTEYGYDTNPASVQHAPLLSKPDSGTYNIMESQAGLILRDYHLQSVFPNFFLSTFYHVRDGTGGGSTIQYSTSGITLGTCCNYAPKESYFIIAGFIELSDGFYGNGTLVHEEPYIVRYQSAGGKYLYALWTYLYPSFFIAQSLTNADSTLLVTPTKNGNVFDTLVPVHGSFSATAGQMPVYLITDEPVDFRIPVCSNNSVTNLNLACGDSALVYGVYRKLSGTYYDTLIGNRCDSIVSTVVKTTCPTVSGYILTELNVPVPGVTVTLSGSASQMMVTGTDGFYSFDLTPGGNYTVTPAKSNDIITNNGVTSFDLALIRRHATGGMLLASPYKIIAADANNSGTVTTADITFTRRVALNNTNTFPVSPAPPIVYGRLWEFVNSSQTFSGPPYNPFPFIKTRSYTNITSSETNQNFIGVKIGDVNNNWDAGIQ